MYRDTSGQACSRLFSSRLGLGMQALAPKCPEDTYMQKMLISSANYCSVGMQGGYHYVAIHVYTCIYNAMQVH